MDLIEPSAEQVLPQPPVAGWITGVGVVVLVFGVLGVIGGLFTVVGTLLLDFFLGMMSQAAGITDELRDQMLGYRIPLLVLASLMLLLAVVQITAGARILGRARIGASLVVMWAWAKIGHVLLSQIVNVPYQRMNVEAQSGSVGGMMPEVLMSVILYASIVFSVLWGVALPVFILIWFRRPSVRAEVSTWT